MREKRIADPPEMRQAVHRHPDSAAPAIFDFDSAQLRKDPFDMRAYESGDICGWTRRIFLAPAEDQPVVGAEPVVIEHEAAFSDRGVGWYQSPSRSEQRRVGKEWARTCRSWRLPDHKK